MGKKEKADWINDAIVEHVYSRLTVLSKEECVEKEKLEKANEVERRKHTVAGKEGLANNSKNKNSLIEQGKGNHNNDEDEDDAGDESESESKTPASRLMSTDSHIGVSSMSMRTSKQEQEQKQKQKQKASPMMADSQNHTARQPHAAKKLQPRVKASNTNKKNNNNKQRGDATPAPASISTATKTVTENSNHNKDARLLTKGEEVSSSQEKSEESPPPSGPWTKRYIRLVRLVEDVATDRKIECDPVYVAMPTATDENPLIVEEEWAKMMGDITSSIREVGAARRQSAVLEEGTRVCLASLDKLACGDKHKHEDKHKDVDLPAQASVQEAQFKTSKTKIEKHSERVVRLLKVQVSPRIVAGPPVLLS